MRTGLTIDGRGGTNLIVIGTKLLDLVKDVGQMSTGKHHMVQTAQHLLAVIVTAEVVSIAT